MDMDDGEAEAEGLEGEDGGEADEAYGMDGVPSRRHGGRQGSRVKVRARLREGVALVTVDRGRA